MTKSSIQLRDHIPSLKEEVTEDIQGRNLGTETEAETIDKYHLLV